MKDNIFEIENEKIISYAGTSYEHKLENTVTIPHLYDGYNIREIQGFSRPTSNIDDCLNTSDGVKRIIIDEGIETIDGFALCDCKHLEYVSFPKSIRYIASADSNIFIGCPPNITVECYKDSYVHKWAQEYMNDPLRGNHNIVLKFKSRLRELLSDASERESSLIK